MVYFSRQGLLLVVENINRIPEELRPSRMFDFKSILPMAAAELYNVDVVQETLRNIIEEEYAEDGEDLQDKLLKHISASNTELADVRVT